MTDQNLINAGTNSSNLYIDINKQGQGSLSGDNVDAKLVAAKVERLLMFEEGMSRHINPSSESTLFTAGQIDASWVNIKILRTQASMYVQNAFLKATSINNITVFVTSIISGKYTVTEQIDYADCYVTKLFTSVFALEGQNLTSLDVSFRFDQRQDTIFFYDQDAKAIGQQVSLVKFSQGTLQPAASGGGGA